MARFRSHVPEVRIQTGSKTVLTAANRSYKSARFVERQSRDAPAEVIPNSVLMQKLFNVRKVKGRDLSAVVSDVFADSADCLRSCEIADDRHDKILAFERFQEDKIFFVSQIASRYALSIRRRHQVRIAYAAKATAARSVIDRGTEAAKVGIDVLDSVQIAIGKRQVMGFRQMISNGFQIFLKQIVGAGCLVDRGEYFPNRRLRSNSLRPFSREQPGNEFGTIFR